MKINDVALSIALTQLGQQEVAAHNNTGVMVNQYLKSVGLPPGFLWCQAFVYWCYEQAALKLAIPNPVIRTAGVLDCWNRTEVKNRLPKNGIVLPGYQVILKYTKISGHTGIVEKVEGDIIHTIEGNSNSNKSREGYMVVRNTRKINDPLLLGIIAYGNSIS